MIPRSFEYYRADSISSALAAIQKHGDHAKLILGGHSLLPMMKLRLAAPELLIDINELTELRGVTISPTSVRIGAATTHAEIEHNRDLAAAVPLLPLVASVIADPAVRNRGTLGGSLAHADPSADWPSAMLALGATIEVRGPRGARRVPATDFFLGLFHTALEPDEILVGVDIPVCPKHRCAYRKFRHPASGYAVVAAAVVLEMEAGGQTVRSGSIGITGYADHAFRATAAESLIRGLKRNAQTSLDQVAQTVFQGVEPLEDRFADADYRLQIGTTMVRRALTVSLSD